MDGVTVVIDAQSRPDTAPDLLDEIEAIVESITFGLRPATGGPIGRPSPIREV